MSINITVRFYEELNDHLPENIRKKDIEIELSENSAVENILDKFGVACKEVHLVLVNGENSLLNRKLHSGDRISIYPVFDSIDISPIKIIHY